MQLTIENDAGGHVLESRLASYDNIHTEVGVKEGRQRFFRREQERKAAEANMREALYIRLEDYKHKNEASRPQQPATG